MLMVQERLAEGQARLEQLRSLAASAAAGGAGTPYPSEDTFDASGGGGHAHAHLRGVCLADEARCLAF